MKVKATLEVEVRPGHEEEDIETQLGKGAEIFFHTESPMWEKISSYVDFLQFVKAAGFLHERDFCEKTGCTWTRLRDEWFSLEHNHIFFEKEARK